ncbi:MAG: urate hydroxylase PuuD, partial [Alphaproteobacteria bacterium]|nr:urate hydroxylase PuuD [Alphaproteobacteria bacterium]
PRALFWFRWAALSTIVFGLILAYMSGYIEEALALGLMDNSAKHASIGFGMWMGLIMAFNVWFIIWPKQKIALGIVEADADAKPAAARMAFLASRTNTMLSIPMLFAMVSAQNIY